MSTQRLLIGVLAVSVAGCSQRREAKQDEAPAEVARAVTSPAPASVALEEDEAMDDLGDNESGGFGAGMAKSEAAPGDAAEKKRAKRRPMSPMKENAVGGKGGGGERESGVQSRSWFPETFLFDPLVVTDDQGKGSVKARVPDRLTTWRVLALAHSRDGAQAGDVTTFLGTMPVYVEAVTPPFLYLGDEVRLPIQVVNTTGTAKTTTLKVEVSSGALSGGSGAVTVPANGSTLRYAVLRATTPGQIQLRAHLGGTDAVVKTIEVRPTGKKVVRTKSGTLAAPRTFDLESPDNASPLTSEVGVAVFPGALAILRSELAAGSRGSLADDAFALLLNGRAPELLAALGDKAEPEALRRGQILLTQKIVRHARTLDVGSATLIAEAALAHPDNPVLSNIGQRAVAELASKQFADGTCGGQDGWPLQRLLVATADCARAAKSNRNVVTRASGTFERQRALITDPYTAAAVLASGGATGVFADELAAMVMAAIKEVPGDQAKYLELPAGVMRADGRSPSRIEAAALAVLALQNHPKAPLADLGATILAGYSPGYGWGDGRTNLTAMQAVLLLFKDPIPDNVAITVAVDGKTVAEGQLNRERIREIVNLDARALDLAGSHSFTVTASPPVPGLGFSLDTRTYVPWPPPASNGLELALAPPTEMTVGKAATITARAVAPSNNQLHIKQPLPAGVQVDRGSLERLVTDGVLARFKDSDGLLELFANPAPPGKMLSFSFRVIPTLAGKLHRGPTQLRVAGVELNVPPQPWVIR